MQMDHRQFAQEWIAAWNSHDLDRIMSHYDDAVMLTSPRARLLLGTEDGTVRGKTALRDYFARGLARLPDLTFKLDEVFPGVQSLVIRFHTKDGRRGAEFMDFAADGYVVRVVAHWAD